MPALSPERGLVPGSLKEATHLLCSSHILSWERPHTVLSVFRVLWVEIRQEGRALAASHGGHLDGAFTQAAFPWEDSDVTLVLSAPLPPSSPQNRLGC